MSDEREGRCGNPYCENGRVKTHAEHANPHWIDCKVCHSTGQEVSKEPPSIDTSAERVDGAGREGEELPRVLPCGCVTCICRDEKQCHGCGADNCGKPDCVFAPGGTRYPHPTPGGGEVERLQPYVDQVIDYIETCDEDVEVNPNIVQLFQAAHAAALKELEGRCAEADRLAMRACSAYDTEKRKVGQLRIQLRESRAECERLNSLLTRSERERVYNSNIADGNKQRAEAAERKLTDWLRTFCYDDLDDIARELRQREEDRITADKAQDEAERQRDAAVGYIRDLHAANDGYPDKPCKCRWCCAAAKGAE